MSTSRPTNHGDPRSARSALACRPRSTVVDQTEMREDWRGDMRDILAADIAFIDDCLKKGVISFAALQEFAQQQGPKLKHIIAWAAQTQVAHWMNVVAGGRRSWAPTGTKTYAASNTIYVARQNNMLFSVLAQFFGPEAINSRLVLIETISFTTTPEDMLEFADPHRRRPGGRRAVLRQRAVNGLRADGRGRARGDHRRRRQARDEAVPAAAGAVRLQPVADPGHAGPGPPRSPIFIELGRLCI